MDYNGGFPVISYLLQQTLRQLCTDSDWIYAVFWRILPRNYPPPKWDSESSFFDRTKGNKRNWILVWEDGYCDFVACAKSNGTSEPNSSTSSQNSSCSGYFDNYHISDEIHTMQPELFFKMSHEVYNFGEGLIGKVAADNSHKWVYKEPSEGDALDYPSSWAQGSLDPHPRTWEAQFRSGIETIAIVAVKEGVIQLGSLKKAYEDLNFVLFLQRKFNYLQSIPGVFAVHPALTQHAALSKKASNTKSSSWPPLDTIDLVNPQASKESWSLDHIEKPKFQRKSTSLSTPLEASDEEFFEHMAHHRISQHQIEDSIPCDEHLLISTHSQLPCELDSSSRPVMPTSLHALLSRLPSVTCRRS